jgi:hypothetical protein
MLSLIPDKGVLCLTHIPPPVNQLLTLGDPRDRRSPEWLKYSDLGLTQEHVPELIRMVTDDEWHWADAESPEVWAPLHAWRVLGQLRPEDAIAPLLYLLDEYDDEDWIADEPPVVYGMMGAPALPALANFLGHGGSATYQPRDPGSTVLYKWWLSISKPFCPASMPIRPPKACQRM